MKEAMKTIDKFAILCLLALVSCGQKDPVGPIPEPEDPVETRTLTFVLPGSAGLFLAIDCKAHDFSRAAMMELTVGVRL